MSVFDDLVATGLQDLEAKIGFKPQVPEPASAPVRARNEAEIRREIDNHDGSDWKRIIVEDGTYGAVVVNKPKVQLWANNLNKAIFKGRISLDAADCLITRCKLTDGVDCHGKRTRVSRCLICDNDGAVAVEISGKDCVADGNEITNTGNGIIIFHALRPIVAHNWFHDQGTPPSDRNAWIYIGQDRQTSRNEQNCFILYNRTESAHRHHHIEMKSSENMIVGNTGVKGRKVANYFVRHGMDNYFALNWMIGQGSCVGASDLRTILVKNQGLAAIRAGEISGNEMRSGEKGIVYAEDTKLCLHDGDIDLGWNNGSGTKPPLRTVRDRCPGRVINTVPSSSFADFRSPPELVAEPVGVFRELTAPGDVGQSWNWP
jgi:hypothetical protein